MDAQRRLEAFVAEVFAPLGRADQQRWGERYVRGLLGAGRRKSMEPMAARLGVDRQGLQQFLADSPWSHQMVLAELAWRMEPVIRPAAWVVDDVSFPKDGHASPGVAAQYCGALGKTANCQVAPSVHLVTDAASCPVDWRLFLPAEGWDVQAAPSEDATTVAERRRRAHIPDEVGHVEKWQLALDMIDELRCWGLDPPLVVADEGYGQDGAFRLALEERGIGYVVGCAPTPRCCPAVPGARHRPGLAPGGRRCPGIGARRRRCTTWSWPPGAARCTRSPGVPGARGHCARGSSRCGSVWRASGSGRPTRKKTCRCAGCWPSGRPGRRSRPRTGSPRFRRMFPCDAWCVWRRSAGGLNTTTAS
jgi:SRSO17 transposase